VGGVRERRFFRAEESFFSERCSIHWPARTSVVMAAEASKKRGEGVGLIKNSTKRLYKKAMRIPEPRSVNISGLRLWSDCQKNFRMGKPK